MTHPLHWPAVTVGLSYSSDTAMVYLAAVLDWFLIITWSNLLMLNRFVLTQFWGNRAALMYCRLGFTNDEKTILGSWEKKVLVSRWPWQPSEGKCIQRLYQRLLPTVKHQFKALIKSHFSFAYSKDKNKHSCLAVWPLYSQNVRNMLPSQCSVVKCSSVCSCWLFMQSVLFWPDIWNKAQLN